MWQCVCVLSVCLTPRPFSCAARPSPALHDNPVHLSFCCICRFCGAKFWMNVNQVSVNTTRAGWPQLCSPPRWWLATSCGWTCPYGLTTWRSRKRSRSRRRRGGWRQRKQPCWWRLTTALMDQDDMQPLSLTDDLQTAKRENTHCSIFRNYPRVKHAVRCLESACTMLSHGISFYVTCYQRNPFVPLVSALCCVHCLNSVRQCRRLCLLSVWRVIESAEDLLLKHSALMNEKSQNYPRDTIICVSMWFFNLFWLMFPRALPQPKHIFHSTMMGLIFDLPWSKNPNESPDKMMCFCFPSADVHVEFILYLCIRHVLWFMSLAGSTCLWWFYCRKSRLIWPFVHQ